MATYDVHLKFTLLSEHAGIQWLLMRALQKKLQVFTEVIQIWSFLIFRMIYIPILYLPTFSESNVWGFTLLWPGFLETFRRLPKISDFPKTSEVCRKCPQMFRRRLSTSKATEKMTIVACFDFVRTQSHHLKPFWIKFSLFIMSKRTVCPYLWVRREKLSLIREINVFSPQVWDSHILRESWQVYNILKV